MTTDPENRSLVRIIVEIAHLFGMQVVGEGVEDEDCLQALMDSGCDYAQGFHFTRPLPAGEFARWLKRWNGRIRPGAGT
jgi:EAL domain-containing protein (putative c-di-GMP-specific phosphodiesterase class I)